MAGMGSPTPRRASLPAEQRRRLVLDTAGRLFYPRGVHEVGMDELVRATGLGKASVYRLFPTKDALIGAYLTDRADTILGYVDADIDRHQGDPAAAIRAILRAVAGDVGRPDFRGCAFNNASIEFADPAHPARAAARDYRAALHGRLSRLAGELRLGPAGAALADALALVIDGMYTNAAHLGPDGPAARGQALVERLLRDDGPDPEGAR